MDCVRCGRSIDTDASFCKFCGAAQPAVGRNDVRSAPDVSDTVQPAQYYPDAAVRAKGGDGWSVGKIMGWGAAGLLAVTFVASLGREADPVANEAIPMMPGGSTDLATVTPTGTPTPAANWDYSTDEDKVRGAKSYLARTTSTNRVDQPAPYDGGTAMTMTVRKHPAWGTDVILSISEGQMMCPSYNGCSGMVRFDDGPARRISFNGPEDNSSETVFVVGAKSFVARLKTAKTVTIEKTLYQAGAPQFEFDVAGLDWDH